MPGGNALKRRTRVPNGFDRAGCKFAKSVKIFPRERSDSKKRFFPQPVNSWPDTKQEYRVDKDLGCKAREHLAPEVLSVIHINCENGLKQGLGEFPHTFPDRLVIVSGVTQD